MEWFFEKDNLVHSSIILKPANFLFKMKAETKFDFDLKLSWALCCCMMFHSEHFQWRLNLIYFSFDLHQPNFTIITRFFSIFRLDKKRLKRNRHTSQIPDWATVIFAELIAKAAESSKARCKLLQKKKTVTLLKWETMH